MTPDQDWGGKTRSGVLWSTLAFIGSRAVTVITTIVVARLLAPAEFGLVAAVIVYLALLELIGDLGMKATVVYEQEQGVTRRVDVAFTLNLIVAAAFTLAGVLAAPLIAGLFGFEEHTGLFRLGALSVMITAFGNVPDALLTRELDFRRRTIPQLVRAGVRGVASIALVVAGLEALGLVLGMLIGTLCWSVTLWILTRYRPRLALDREVVRSMISYGAGATMLSVVSVIATRVDQVVIGRVLGPAALGLYSIAFRIPEMLIDSVSWNVSQVAFPALSRQRARDAQGLGAATTTIVRYQSLYAVPVSAGLAVLAPPLIVVLFGSKWEEAGGVMSAVAVISGIVAIVFPLGDVFKAIGRQRTLVVLNLIQLPTFIAAVVAFAHEGVVPVAWARAVVTLLFALTTFWLVMRATGMRLADVAGAVRGAVAAGVGVTLGAGAVRIAWPDLSAGPLLAGTAAAAVCGYLVVRLAAPDTARELRGWATAARTRLRPAGVGA